MKNNDDNTKALLWSYEIIVPNEMVSLTEHSYYTLREKLAEHLDHLVLNDFNKLISILYRIDIAQEKAILELNKNAEGVSPGEILARLIIERQLQKIKTRRKYRKE